MNQEFIPAVVTPIKNGAMDLQAYERFLMHLKERGIKKILALGSTGEGVGLFPQDFVFVMEVVERSGLECVLCIANPNPYKVLEIIGAVKHFSVSAYMICPPFTTKSKQEDVISYYQLISSKADKPLMIYNNPARFGLNITWESYQTILHTCNICGIKECAALEDSIWDKLRSATTGTSVKLYAGDDDNWHQLSVDGCISVIGNIIPEVGVELAQGDMSELVTWHKYCKLFRVGSNPANVKYLLARRGLMGEETWLAFAPLSDSQKTELDELDICF